MKRQMSFARGVGGFGFYCFCFYCFCFCGFSFCVEIESCGEQKGRKDVEEEMQTFKRW